MAWGWLILPSLRLPDCSTALINVRAFHGDWARASHSSRTARKPADTEWTGFYLAIYEAVRRTLSFPGRHLAIKVNKSPGLINPVQTRGFIIPWLLVCDWLYNVKYEKKKTLFFFLFFFNRRWLNSVHAGFLWLSPGVGKNLLTPWI